MLSVIRDKGRVKERKREREYNRLFLSLNYANPGHLTVANCREGKGEWHLQMCNVLRQHIHACVCICVCPDSSCCCAMFVERETYLKANEWRGRRGRRRRKAKNQTETKDEECECIWQYECGEPTQPARITTTTITITQQHTHTHEDMHALKHRQSSKSTHLVACVPRCCYYCCYCFCCCCFSFICSFRSLSGNSSSALNGKNAKIKQTFICIHMHAHVCVPVCVLLYTLWL